MADIIPFDIARLSINDIFVNYKFQDGSGQCVAVVRNVYTNEDRGADGSMPFARDLVLIGALSTDPEHGDAIAVPKSEEGAHQPGTWVPIGKHA
jgi:hypothetical protein